MKFNELNLSKEIEKAISDMGFEEPTPIQSQSIPVLLTGKDMIGQAQTGTGKTAAFGIPIIEKIDTHSKSVQAIVLCPTRELAIQVAEELTLLLKYRKNIHVVPIYGGQSMDRQIKTLKHGVQIVIATPGRLIDHIQRKTINLSSVNMIILDEADKMLDMGFIEPIEYILKKASPERQTVLFSATMPPPIIKLSKKYLKEPEHVQIVHKEMTVPGINQYYYEVKTGCKLETLSRVLDTYNPKLSLVFTNTKRGADKLVKNLGTRGYLADALHGNLKQSQRDKVMAKFRTGKIDILVATDVAARGIDVDEIDAVFNYDMPQDEEYYVHRIGRTARAGRAGHSFTFAEGNELYKIKDIERYTKSKIIRKMLPTMEDTEEIKTNSLTSKIKEAIGDGSQLKKYDEIIEKLLSDDYTSVEIASGLLKILMESNTEKKQVKTFEEDVQFDNKKNIGKKRTVKEFRNKEPRRGERNRSSKANDNMKRLYVSAGRKHNVTAGDILGAFAGETGMPGNLIGEIEIYDKFSFVEIPADYLTKVLKIMNERQIKGNNVNVEVATEKR